MKLFFINIVFNLAYIFLALDNRNLKDSSRDVILMDNPNFNIKCFLFNDYNVYDIGGLSRPFKNKEDLTIPSINQKAKIYYNFCENTLFKCNEVSSLMIAVYNDKCEILAGPAKNLNKWILEKDPNNVNNTQISITLNHGQKCTKDLSKNYTITYKLICNSNGEKRKIDWDNKTLESFDPELCENTLTAKTVEACSQVNFYVLAEFLKKYNYLFGTAMILLGIFELFFGVKLVVFTTFIISTGLVISVVFIFFFEFIIPKGTNPNIVWVILGISSVIGIVLGYFLSKVYKVFVGIFGNLANKLGGYIGYILGSLLYTFLMSRIDWNQNTLQLITIFSMILICLLLSYFFADFILITCTSFIGGYLTIRGVSLYAGGFPNEQLIKDLMNRGEYEEIKKVLDLVAYIYFASWLVLFILGIIIQLKINKEEEKNIDEKKINNTNFYFKMDK